MLLDCDNLLDPHLDISVAGCTYNSHHDTIADDDDDDDVIVHNSKTRNMLDWGLLDPRPDDSQNKKSPKKHPILRCMYKENCTELFKAIDNKQWSDVAHFLDTATWPGFSGFTAPDFPPLQQIVTIVTNVAYNNTDDNWSYLPLHLALLRHAPMDIVGRLVDGAPHTATIPDNQGNLALHVAMFMNSRYEIQEYILRNNPSAVTSVNKDGDTPLQCALRVRNNQRAAVRGHIILTFTVLGSAPPAVPRKQEMDLFCDYDIDCSPLFQMITEKAWSSVDLFLTKGKWSDSVGIEQVFWHLFSSNHHQEESNPQEQVMTWVTKCNRRKVVWAQLPIHAATAVGAPLKVLQKLTSLFPRSVTIPDDKGLLPLHLALKKNAKDDVVSFLLDRFPQAVRVRDTIGRSALDMALQQGMRGKLIRGFMAAQQRTNKNDPSMTITCTRELRE